MSRKLKITRDPLYEDDFLYKKSYMTFEEGVTILVGCNGSGKSTLLKELEGKFKKDKTPFIRFNNLTQGGSNMKSEQAFFGNFQFVANAMCSSEGEEIMLNLKYKAAEIGRYVSEHQDIKELWVLMDAIDGLSIDAIYDLKEYLFKTILEDERLKDVSIYIIVSTNVYEMVRNEKCFDVVEGKYITIKDYEDYRKAIFNSRKYKEERYSKQD